MQLIIFYIFAAILLFAATMVITTRNPVHAAMFLVLTFFTAAATWLLAQAEFLGIALVLVYVGAVMVLFLFVVMMLDINVAPLREGFIRYLPLGLVIGVVMVLEMILVVSSDQMELIGAAGQALDVPNNISAIGAVLYTDYLYPFELASIVLLVAIIAAILLTHRRRGGTKHQDPAKQVLVRKSDRLRLVNIPSEGRAVVREEKTEAQQ